MLKKILFIIAIIGLGIAIYVYGQAWFFQPTESSIQEYGEVNNNAVASLGNYQLSDQMIATNLEVPWEVLYLPNTMVIYSERPGRITLQSELGYTEIYNNENFSASGEGGLLGMALHPNFQTSDNWLYIYETYDSNDGQTLNRVVRFRFDTGSDPMLTAREIIIDNIPGAMYHDGGRIVFGPDNNLYITTGDATMPDLSQDLNSLAGKILRVQDDGTIPSDNPFSNSAVYSYGHRNPQGLAWDGSGNMYATEHGPSGINSGQDELNQIVAGGNYGWPFFSGTERPGPTEDSPIPDPQFPIAASGPDEVWAPAGLSYWQGDLWFGGLRGQALYQYDIDSAELLRHLSGELGRIRTTTVTPSGDLAITTSNRDGRGSPASDDDKIVLYQVRN